VTTHTGCTLRALLRRPVRRQSHPREQRHDHPAPAQPGGNRQANAALWRIVMVRMSSDPRTQAYVERRTKEGLSKKKIIRCLKRYVARELYRYLPQETTA